MRGVLLLVLAWLLAAPAAAPIAPPVADVFPSVSEVRAAHGVARVELHAIVDPVTGFPAFTWNTRLGEVPTIRVRPGDAIEMTLHNDMRPFRDRPDDVNVHFHGLTVSPRPPGDDALGTLARPGETIRYRVVIPRHHAPGLYWYHPHAHGETFYEVTNGMSGAIVVEGLQQHLPALAAMRERILVLRDVPTGPGFVDDDMPVTGMAGMSQPSHSIPRTTGPPCRAEPGLQPTVNRQPAAHIAIRAGESQLFRVVNASAARYFDLTVDGASLSLVALDGVPLDAYPGTRPFRAVSHVRIPPAGRAEFVVTPARIPTVLRSACVDTGPAGDANPAVVLARLVDPTASGGVSARPGSGPSSRIGTPLAPSPYLRAPPAPAARRTIRFTEDDRGFYIDGKAFRMDGPAEVVARSGTVEEWTIVNATDEVHDFHLHQVHFVVDAVNGAAASERAWVDTADVPAQTRRAHRPPVPGRIRVTVDFRDPIVRGTFVYHCHILDHEDRGMMAKIRVI